MDGCSSAARSPKASRPAIASAGSWPDATRRASSGSILAERRDLDARADGRRGVPGQRRYDRHLRTLRGKLASQVKTFREAIASSFPIGTTVSDPRGSYLLWVELPRGVDALQLQAEAARRGIAIAPGPIFAAGKRYKSHIRVNCGFPWRGRSPMRCAPSGSSRRRSARCGSFRVWVPSYIEAQVW